VEAILASIRLSAGRENRDFGGGFYVTTWQWQAWDWASQRERGQRPNAPRSMAAVVWFEVNRDALAALDWLSFVRAGPDADDYWTFVERCRSGDHRHRDDPRRPMYDGVCGPVVRNWRSRRYHRDYDQFSIHTSAAVALFDGSAKGEVQR
jgi:hypothetical protein